MMESWMNINVILKLKLSKNFVNIEVVVSSKVISIFYFIVKTFNIILYIQNLRLLILNVEYIVQ